MQGTASWALSHFFFEIRLPLRFSLSCLLSIFSLQAAFLFFFLLCSNCCRSFSDLASSFASVAAATRFASRVWSTYLKASHYIARSEGPKEKKAETGLAHRYFCISPRITINGLHFRHPWKSKESETFRHSNQIKIFYPENVWGFVLGIGPDKGNKGLHGLWKWVLEHTLELCLEKYLPGHELPCQFWQQRESDPKRDRHLDLLAGYPAAGRGPLHFPRDTVFVSVGFFECLESLTLD